MSDSAPKSHFFTGSYPFKTDAKNRVNVPAVWNMPEGTELLLSKKEYHGTPMIRVLTREAFEKFIAEYTNRADLADHEKREIKEHFAGMVQYATLGGQGKLQLPKNLCDEVGISPSVSVNVVGRIDYFDVMPATATNGDSPSAASIEKLIGKTGFIG